MYISTRIILGHTENEIGCCYNNIHVHVRVLRYMYMCVVVGIHIAGQESAQECYGLQRRPAILALQDTASESCKY